VCEPTEDRRETRVRGDVVMPRTWPPPRRRPASRAAPPSDRLDRIERLVEAMTWPPRVERWRLDGEVRRRTAPLLAELLSALGRLKAVLAGLVADDRPVVLDGASQGGELDPDGAIASFQPRRFVAVCGDDAELRAPTDPFAGLADRALKVFLPELEITLTELTVFLNEYLFHQELDLQDVLDALPHEMLAALEEAAVQWRQTGHEAELARLWAHLRDGVHLPSAGDRGAR